MANTKFMITCMLHFRELYPELCLRIIPANYTTNHIHIYRRECETYPETYPRNIPRIIPAWCNTLCWARSFRKGPYICVLDLDFLCYFQDLGIRYVKINLIFLLKIRHLYDFFLRWRIRWFIYLFYMGLYVK